MNKAGFHKLILLPLNQKIYTKGDTLIQQFNSTSKNDIKISKVVKKIAEKMRFIDFFVSIVWTVIHIVFCWRISNEKSTKFCTSWEFFLIEIKMDESYYFILVQLQSIFLLKRTLRPGRGPNSVYSWISIFVINIDRDQ